MINYCVVVVVLVAVIVVISLQKNGIIHSLFENENKARVFHFQIKCNNSIYLHQRSFNLNKVKSIVAFTHSVHVLCMHKGSFRFPRQRQKVLQTNECYCLHIFIYIWSMSTVNKLKEIDKHINMTAFVVGSFWAASSLWFYRKKNFSIPSIFVKWEITTVITNNFGCAQQIHCCHWAHTHSWTAPWPNVLHATCVCFVRLLTRSFSVWFVGLIYLVNCLMYNNQCGAQLKDRKHESKMGSDGECERVKRGACGP